MALLGNYYLLNKLPLKFSGGVSTAALAIGGMRSNFNRTDRTRNMFLNATWGSKNGTPNGYRPPHCWTIATTSGGLSCYKNIAGIGATSYARLVKGQYIVATITGVGEITLPIVMAGKGWIVAIATIEGTGAISLSSLTAALYGVASLSGSGALTNANLNAIGIIVTSIDGSGGVSVAHLNAVVGMLAEILGQGNIAFVNLSGGKYGEATFEGFGDLTEADLTGKGWMEAVMVIGALPSTETEEIISAVSNKIQEIINSVDDSKAELLDVLANSDDKIVDIQTKTDEISDVKLETDKIQAIMEGIGDVLSDTDFVKRVTGGRLKIVGSQMIFYSENNETEIMRFDLYDISGKLTTDPKKVYERRRV